MNIGDNLSSRFQKEPSQDTLVDKLTKEIASNLNNDQFGVDSLAQAMGMSRSSLHRKLHKRLGVSTSQFIREYRLKRALEILINEDITASETAYRVGFSSPTYFNTCFHKFYDFTPGEIKSRNTDEVERLIHGESAATEKTGTKNRTVWAALLAMAIVSLGVYFYSTTSKENEQITETQPTTGEKSIAVMPLKNWTGNPDLEYVSDGMTDAVISGLTKINSIDKVTPFSSILNYKETDKTSKEIATELGVATLLQGNLQISGNQIKINLQLIDGLSNDHLWSEEYMKEWKSDEIFKIQADVVEGIAKILNVAIAENEFETIQKVPTKSKQAYSYYLQAEFQLYKLNASTYANAIPLYEKAIALDSNFVEAYRGLAHVWNISGRLWGNNDEHTAWSNTKRFLKKALEIDHNNKEVEEILHFGYLYYDWDFEKSEGYYQLCLKDSLTDEYPPINADYGIKTGRYQEAINALDEEILVDPSIGVVFCFKARALMGMDKPKEALEVLRTTNSLHSDNFGYLGESARHYFYLGEYEKSKIQLKKIFDRFQDYPPILVWFNAVYAQMDGNQNEAADYLAELQDRYQKGTSGSPAWFIALYYCTLEDYETAFIWLQKSYDGHEAEMTWLREEPLLTPIRGDSRYKELYEKIGFSKIGLPIKTTSKTPSP